ncbi:hypothetical protein D9M68_702040 [compost metagenome]
MGPLQLARLAGNGQGLFGYRAGRAVLLEVLAALQLSLFAVVLFGQAQAFHVRLALGFGHGFHGSSWQDGGVGVMLGRGDCVGQGFLVVLLVLDELLVLVMDGDQVHQVSGRPAHYAQGQAAFHQLEHLGQVGQTRNEGGGAARHGFQPGSSSTGGARCLAEMPQEQGERIA